MTLGEKLKKLRLQQGMTLQDVADSTGYSKALISRIENDSVSPSISSLVKISTALSVKLNELFAAIEEAATSIVRKNKGRISTLSGGKVKVESLFEQGRKMRIAVTTFDAGGVVKQDEAPEGGEEWWHMLKGTLEASIGERDYQLREGDSMYAPSSLPRRWRNPGKVKASALVAIIPPPS